MTFFFIIHIVRNFVMYVYVQVINLLLSKSCAVSLLVDNNYIITGIMYVYNYVISVHSTCTKKVFLILIK